MFKRICAVSCLCAVLAVASEARTLKPIVTFNQSNGERVFGPPIEAADHNFYGATVFGGTSGYGTIYKLARTGAYKVIYNFCTKSGCPDGEYPSWLVQAADGDFYGTTYQGGGTGNGGTIFKISASGKFTTLYTFCAKTNCADGTMPQSSLVQTRDGAFYGTTTAGGASDFGTVFKFVPGHGLTTLYSFCSKTGCSDGSFPYIGLTLAGDGNFYGTTAEGGNHNASLCPGDGCGTVFRITPRGKLTTVYRFCAQTGCNDGVVPQGLLAQGKDGNLYGTTDNGGGQYSGGTIYKISLKGKFTVLHAFYCNGACTDGAIPYAGLIQAADGNFYGTAFLGGSGGWGTVFQMTPAGKVTALYGFDGKADGAFAAASLLQASSGNFYSGTEQGGNDNCNAPNGCGVIFVLSKKAATEAANNNSRALTDQGKPTVIVGQPIPPRRVVD